MKLDLVVALVMLICSYLLVLYWSLLSSSEDLCWLTDLCPRG